MKNVMKKFSAIILALALTVTYVPVAYAVEPLAEISAVEETVDEEQSREIISEEVQKEETEKEEEIVEIKVFETTDIHGHISDISSYDEDTFEYRLAYIAKRVNDAREKGDVILLDGGDTYQGTAHSNKLYGAPLMAAFEYMKYDAMALGNHEFDWDVSKYACDDKGTMAPYSFGSYSGDADIPVLMANLYDLNGNKVNFTQDYTIVERSGVKVGIVGWTDDYSADIKADKIAPYIIDTDKEKMNKLIEKVADETDAVILLTHSDPVSVAGYVENPELVDIVAGGHTHTATNGVTENGIAYIQGNSKAKGYSEATIKVNKGTKEVVVEDPHYINITSKDSRELLYEKNAKDLDTEVVNISKEAWEILKPEMMEVIGTIDKGITRKKPINEETTATTAGNWMCDLMLEMTKDLNTVAAFTNRGGIRTDFEMPEGQTKRPITVADIYTISPFGNKIVTFKISGKQIAKHLENALTGLNPEIGWDGGYQDSNYGDQMAGIKATYKVVDGGIKVVSIVTDDGKYIDINDEVPKYNVCINEYASTKEGSVFAGLEPLVPADQAPVDNLEIIEILKNKTAEAGKPYEMVIDDNATTVKLETRLKEVKTEVDTIKNNGVKVENKDMLNSLSEELNVLSASGLLNEDEIKDVEKISADIKELISKIDLEKEESDKDTNKETDKKTEQKPDVKPNVKPAKGSKPKTGDMSPVFVWMAVFALSGTLSVTAFRRKRR